MDSLPISRIHYESVSEIHSKFTMNSLWFSRIDFEFMIFFVNLLFFMNQWLIIRIHNRSILFPRIKNWSIIFFYGNSLLINYLFRDFILCWLFSAASLWIDFKLIIFFVNLLFIWRIHYKCIIIFSNSRLIHYGFTFTMDLLFREFTMFFVNLPFI